MCFLALVASWILVGSYMSGEDPALPGDMLVVLGGSADGSRERLACRIWVAGFVSGPVILTGGTRDGSLEDRTLSLERCGIPTRNVSSWDGTGNTYEEMRAIGEFLVAEGVGRAIVVSDAPHMPRLRFLRKVLRLEGRVTFRESQLTLEPDAVSLMRAVVFWAREPAAYFYYRLMYHD